jgi:hypothetical protein
MMTDCRCDESKNGAIFLEDAVIFEKEVGELGCLVITGGCIEMLQGCFILYACSLLKSMALLTCLTIDQ